MLEAAAAPTGTPLQRRSRRPQIGSAQPLGEFGLATNGVVIVLIQINAYIDQLSGNGEITSLAAWHRRVGISMPAGWFYARPWRPSA